MGVWQGLQDFWNDYIWLEPLRLDDVIEENIPFQLPKWYTRSFYVGALVFGWTGGLYHGWMVGMKGKALKLYSVKTALHNLPLTFMILELARMIGRKELKKDFNITNDSKVLEKRRNDSVDQCDI